MSDAEDFDPHTRAEILQLLADTQKLLAETRKFNREPRYLIAVTIITVVGGIVVRLPEILRAFGRG